MVLLNNDEKIIFIARRHWFVFALELLTFLLLALAPIFLYPFFGEIWGAYLFFYSVWLVVLWLLIFSVWTDFYLDVWIITNQRVVDIEQKGFFRREIASCNLQDIQDLTTTVSGIIPTLLNYGRINIQTAGEKREFTLSTAANPELIKRKILEAKNGS